MDVGHFARRPRRRLGVEGASESSLRLKRARRVYQSIRSLDQHNDANFCGGIWQTDLISLFFILW